MCIFSTYVEPRAGFEPAPFFVHKKLLDSDLLKSSTLDDSVFNATATPSELLAPPSGLEPETY